MRMHFKRFPRKGSVCGKAFVWTECKIWARQMSDIILMWTKGRNVWVSTTRCETILLQQTISSVKAIFNQPILSLYIYIFQWDSINPNETKQSEAIWLIVNLFVSHFKGSTVFRDDNGHWARQICKSQSWPNNIYYIHIPLAELTSHLQTILVCVFFIRKSSTSSVHRRWQRHHQPGAAVEQ